jgi:acetylornithine deacetylase/succinyl-diaminopimelate desuccinylase-like protein
VVSHPPPAATGDARVAASASATGAALARARAGRRATLRELQCFASFPTISADPASEAAMRQAATWLAMYLRRIGLQHARVLAPGRRTPPLVYADWCHAPARPTVLIYGHYDVQPADPVADWHSAPFRPTVRGDRIYARGITDDKGQLFAHLAAVQALSKVRKRSVARISGRLSHATRRRCVPTRASSPTRPCSVPIVRR